MSRKIDIILKLIITAAIIITLFFLVFPDLKEDGGMASGERQAAGTNLPAGGQRASGPGKPAAAGQAVKAFMAVKGTVSNYIKVNGDIVTDTAINIYPDVSGVIVRQEMSVGKRVQKNQTVAVVDPSLPGQNFAESAVYSTIGGTVLKISARIGDKVSTNTSIITIGDLSDLKLITYIPEKYAGYLRIGLPAEISFTAYPEESFSSVITEINPVIDSVSRTIEITLRINDRSNRVKPGMFASVKLVTEQAVNVISIPARAVFKYYGKDTVFVIKHDNTVERRNVTIGLESVEMVEITEGLETDELVVTEGQSLLKEGTLVKIAEQE